MISVIEASKALGHPALGWIVLHSKHGAIAHLWGSGAEQRANELALQLKR